MKSITSWKWGGSLQFVFSCASPVTWHYKQRIHLIQKNTCGKHALPCGKPYRVIASVVSEKNWNTKEDKGKTMMHVLYVLRLAKRHFSRQSNVKQWRNQVRSHIHCWVMLGWRHQWVSEWVSQHKIRLNRKFQKIHKNSMKGFRVTTLKSFLG